jgi:hypothetical protein
MMVSPYGFVDEVLPYGRIRWTRANRSSGDARGWTRGYSMGEATALPSTGLVEAPEVGQVVPLYLHGEKFFYGPSAGE